MDLELLSRLQFAFTLTFHYIYPPLSIGIGLALIFMEGMYLKTKDVMWEKITKFWIKVFSLTFALGVATGIPLQFSLGANWSRWSRYVGDVFGSVIGAEGFFAFLIEAGFLGLLLFGWDRVSSKVHFIATFFVAFGAHFSAIWIVSANSWMHTPAGYEVLTDVNGITYAKVTDWWAMFLNPSNLSHITHVILSAWATGAFLILSVAAYYLLKKQHIEFAKKNMHVGLCIALFAVLAQLLSGDHLAKKVSVHNPEKFAALEGVYKTEPYTPLYAFGWVDGSKQIVHGLKMPGGLSYLTYGNAATPIKGLDNFPREEWPNVPAVFQMYHLMVLMWGLMFAAVMCATYIVWKNRWTINKWVLRFIVIAVLFPQIANITGWYTSCMGRQPWTVYKLLKTSESFTNTLSTGQLIGSLIMFIAMYLLFFALFLLLLDKKIKHGPVEDEQLPYRDVYKDR